ncbi:class I SAM-dependent methyltransferase [Enterobacillus tribolii]|uniref:Methyltransferase family protein n=1 Tax=Enterobacillus tribolii TaxID=1487935 RepID=A0A370Q6Y4_9GAMM|nr:class I SAM-dependent methyltransferase [Enterobacillus tribolii]MBW7984885.1 class I SAM-dependent methyltransferase [Enterobacillus tribolii]RDK84097.1 methyltransferase family protein [Enterobacillus tribolii]
MTLSDLIKRAIPATPWQSGEKIPWNDESFSVRMLENHLSQEHDWASRRFRVIEQQIHQITARLGSDRRRVLDLGCGPGFYLQRLAAKGYRCTGVDFSPASIRYAKEQAAKDGFNIDYVLSDIRTYHSTERFDFIMLTFGEFNVFSRDDIERLLPQVASMLNPGGMLLTEVHTWDEVCRQGMQESSWQTLESGLFSAAPHLLLQENFWDGEQQIATSSYWVIEEGDKVSRYDSSMQAYTQDGYRKLFASCGFAPVGTQPSASWQPGEEFKNKLDAYWWQKA